MTTNHIVYHAQLIIKQNNIMYNVYNIGKNVIKKLLLFINIL